MHLGATDLNTLLDLATGDPKTIISAIEVHTAWGPPIIVNEPFKPSPPGAADPLAALKPKIIVRLRGTAKGLVAAPYGDPGPTKWPYIQAGIVGLCGLVLYYVWTNQKRCKR